MQTQTVPRQESMPTALSAGECGRDDVVESSSNHEPMCVLESRVYRGPNPYGYRPVVRLKLALGTLEDYPTSRLGNFSERLLQIIPTLQQHGCSVGKPGGFVQRLDRGTWLAHVAEHIAIELQCLAATPVTYGKTRGTGERGQYNVVYSFLEERVGLLAGWLALRLINHLLPPHLQGIQDLEKLLPDDTLPLVDPATPFDYQRELEALIRRAERLALGPTTQSLVDEARRRGIPAIRLDEYSLVQLGYGKYQQRIRASVTSHTSHLALETAGNKALTTRLLDDAGIPTPRGTKVRSVDEAVTVAKKIGYPVVVKPLDTSHGRGVSLNLTDEEQVRWAYDQAAKYRTSVLVEKYLHGHDYRILVINKKLIAAAQRVPAHVKGDGRHSIGELIEITNRDPRRGIGHEKVLTRITIDAQAERLLEAASYTLETVLPKGEIFYLRATGNMSTGGTAVDVTDVMHPDNVEIAVRAAQIIGLDVAGIDMISPDITKSLCETGGGICEVNAGPGFRMHLQPSEGKPRNVARPVIDMLFPDNVPARIPMVAITGTNGKTTTSRMVAHILKTNGLRVGLTTSTGIYIDDELLQSGDTTGPKSARMVLRDPTVEAAVLETARGGILREGLGFDRCDVGAVLNISADHLGLKGVETLEDLANIKSLVVEVVQKNGYSVLNADDPLTTGMSRRAGGQLVYFSMHGGSDAPEHLREHIGQGGLAVVLQPGLKGDMITIYDKEKYLPLMWAREIPATLGGKATVNVANALAAAAIAYAMQVPTETIKQGLSTFVTSYEQSPGRMNIYDKLPFRVIMDYAHNPAAMEHMADLVAKLRAEHKRVIAVLAGTGDRRDEDIELLGKLVGSIADELILKEDERRGRRVGETSALLKRGALAAGLSEENITDWMPEPKAVETALRHAHPGDLVLVFASKPSLVWQQITNWPTSGDAPKSQQNGNINPQAGKAISEVVASLNGTATNGSSPTSSDHQGTLKSIVGANGDGTPRPSEAPAAVLTQETTSDTDGAVGDD
jgi:cyanophycin synthetase